MRLSKKLRQRKLHDATTAAKTVNKRDPAVRRGFRKLVVNGKLYQWRYYGQSVEIRTPDDKKMTVPIWRIHGFESEAAWLKDHEDDDGDFGYAYAISPGLVRKYIDSINRETA